LVFTALCTSVQIFGSVWRWNATSHPLLSACARRAPYRRLDVRARPHLTEATSSQGWEHSETPWSSPPRAMCRPACRAWPTGRAPRQTTGSRGVPSCAPYRDPRARFLRC
jgi:hypothetical protein